MLIEAPSRLRYTIPDGEARAELVIKNSVFVGTIAHAANATLAHAHIDRVRSRYKDADHNAWAYIIAGGPQAEVASWDDGEPGGTAGRPMLAVIEGHGLVEAVVVGTRYFGGIKLGTGGLVRAYGECVRRALETLPVAEMVYYHRAVISVDYALYGMLKYALPRHGVLMDDETFRVVVDLTISIPPETLEAVTGLLSEASNGSVRLPEHIEGGHYVNRPA
jgi:uncharacterized YigZ family protein